MLYLTISHLIFLTREQRYALINGENVTVIGVNIPTWVENLETSEPAVEIFCRYELQSKPSVVSLLKTIDGYCINLPQKKDKEILPIPNEIWRTIPFDAQEAWYQQHRPIHAVNSLRDITDNGAQYLNFSYISLTKELKTIHYVEIKTIESLMESLDSVVS